MKKLTYKRVSELLTEHRIQMTGDSSIKADLAKGYSDAALIGKAIVDAINESIDNDKKGDK